MLTLSHIFLTYRRKHLICFVSMAIHLIMVWSYAGMGKSILQSILEIVPVAPLTWSCDHNSGTWQLIHIQGNV